MRIQGQCHCGAVNYEAEVEPGTVILCHCSDCQTFAGAPYRAMIRPDPGTFQLRGTPVHYPKTADSGAIREQAFCGRCGTHLYARDPDGGRLGLRIGAIAERHELGAPSRQLWCESALEWAFDLEQIPRSAKS